jgi:hypothetical protein
LKISIEGEARCQKGFNKVGLKRGAALASEVKLRLEVVDVYGKPIPETIDDIDDAAGIEHVFQVVHNAVSSQPTHPYNIHEILVGYQHLDPGYTFQI